MSYDIFLWTKQRPEIQETKIEIADALLTIDSPYQVEAEDIPAHILLQYESIAYMTAMYLQPYTHNEEVVKKALKMASVYAEKYQGVVDDPQTEQIKTKLHKAKLPTQSADAPTVSLTLCFPPDTDLHKKLPQFLELLEKHLPAALPRRYGDYEPLPYKYDEMGKEHFTNFVEASDSMVFWKGTKPVTYVFLCNGSKWHSPSVGTAYSSITLHIFKEIYAKTNYQAAVHLLLKKSAALFGVFFAQVIDSNEHVIGGLRWRGIPKKTGYAFVIGEPYYSLLKLNAYRGEKIGENQMYFTAKCRPRIPSKYISRRKLFWPVKTVSHEMNTVARDIPIT